ncbi:hypothetical protein ACSHMX_001545, partial [Serratia marcescens]
LSCTLCIEISKNVQEIKCKLNRLHSSDIGLYKNFLISFFTLGLIKDVPFTQMTLFPCWQHGFLSWLP